MIKIKINPKLKLKEMTGRLFVIGLLKAHKKPYKTEKTSGPDMLEDGRLLEDLTREEILNLK